MMKRFISVVCILTLIASAFSVAAGDGASAFIDVEADRYYYDGVKYCVENGLMNGLSETVFGPNDSMSRAMFVTVLWRMEGEPAAGAAGTSFADVRTGAYYESAVKWAAENGIVSGTSATAFSPDTAITREMMCTLFVRYARYKGYSLPIGAPDMSSEWYHIDTMFASYEMYDPLNQTMPFEFYDSLDISAYAFDAVYVCYNAEVITGVSEVEFAPLATATRGQVATVIKRFMSKIAYSVTELAEEGKVTYTFTDMLGDTFAEQVDTLDARGRVIESVYTEKKYVRSEKCEYSAQGLMTSHIYEDSDGIYQRTDFDPETGRGTVELSDGTVNASAEYILGEFGMDELHLHTESVQGDFLYTHTYEENDYQYTYEDGVLTECTVRSSVISKSALGTFKTTTTTRNIYKYDESGVLCGVKVIEGSDESEYTEVAFNAERTLYSFREVYDDGLEYLLSYDKLAGTVTMTVDGESCVLDTIATVS